MRNIMNRTAKVNRLEKELKTSRKLNKMLVETAVKLSKENKELELKVFDPSNKVVNEVYELLTDWIDKPYDDGETADKLKFSREVVLLVESELMHK